MEPKHHSRHFRLGGLTLVELIITLAIASILLTLAIPNFRSLIRETAITTAVNLMVAHLHLARSESINRRERSTLCPSRDGKHCLDDYQWHHGFILFTDLNRNGAIDDDDPVLRIHQADNSGIQIITSTGRRQLGYRPDGTSPGINATISFCDTENIAQPRAIIISNTGRPRLSKKRGDGSKIVCQ